MYEVIILNPHSDRWETWSYDDVVRARYVWDWALRYSHRVASARP